MGEGPTVDLVMFSRASFMKASFQVSSRESMAPMTVSRTWSSRNLCRLEICGGRSEQKLRDKSGRVMGESPVGAEVERG